MSKSSVAKAVQKVTGMWWPDADPGKLRRVADAWDAMATALDNVTVPTNKAAAAIVANNHGPAIDAFGKFWGRYYGGKDKGWLPETAAACRALAKALRDFAHEVDKAIDKLEEEAALVAGTLLAGTALAIVTVGISEGAALAASAAIVATAASVGITVSETIALIAATVLVGAAFGAVEAITVDLAVAQPIRVELFGDGGYSLDEAVEAGKSGEIMGAAGGGLGAGGRALVKAAAGAEAAPLALTGLAKAATAAESLPGRMAVGAGLTYAYDSTFQTGPVMPLDLITGAVGASAAPRGKAGRSLSQAGEGQEYLLRTGGSDYIDPPESEKTRQAYEKIRQTAGDTERIAANTGFDVDVLNRIKNHIFERVHARVPVPPEGAPATGRFAPMDHIAEMWQKAEAGTLTPEESTKFFRWACHEGVESILMAPPHNLPYRQGYWEDGTHWPVRDDWGAHEVAPHEHRQDAFSAWEKLGLERPGFPIAEDLSNLDEIAALILAQRKTP
ncbi:hypothetical protein ABTZ03_42995 [Kitasatospora sp. NPDC096077]|uniref:WXG100-like domain-containing protein n=1 Tax=Kitasatospora sp. NPDC096077 TaxID=3155544 RepID=UPI00332C8807